MIVCDSSSKEDAIASLLKKEFKLSNAQVLNWMMKKYEPSSMFCLLENGRLAGFLQSFKRTFILNGKQAEVSVLTDPVLDSSFAQSDGASLLWNAALDQAEKSSLIALYKSSDANFANHHGFGRIATYKCADIAKSGKPRLFENVRVYKKTDDLYSVYKTFLDNFDASIHLTSSQFQDLIDFSLKSGKKIKVHLQNGILDGFCIGSANQKTFEIDCIVYTNLDALLDMTDSLGQIWKDVRLHVTDRKSVV